MMKYLREGLYVITYLMGLAISFPGMILIQLAEWLNPKNNEDENENL